jgi:hypothetical protein
MLGPEFREMFEEAVSSGVNVDETYGFEQIKDLLKPRVRSNQRPKGETTATSDFLA